MSSYSQSVSVATRTEKAATPGERRRRRALIVTGLIGLGSLGLLADLLVVGHTSGEEIWGPITAACAALVSVLSLAYLGWNGRNRAARYVIYGLWVMVAFFGFGGYNDHRLPVPADVADGRNRPPLAPLVFTGLGIAGAISLRYGAKGD